MSATGSSTQRLHPALLPRLLWPVAIVFVSTVWIGLSTVLWTRDAANDLSDERDRAQAVAAVTAIVGKVSDAAADAVARRVPMPADDGASASAWTTRLRPTLPDLVRAYRVSPSRGWAEAGEPGEPGEGSRWSPDGATILALSETLHPPSVDADASRPAVESRLVAARSHLFVASAVKLPPRWLDGRIVDDLELVLWTALDTERLARVALVRGVRGLAIAGSDESISLPVASLPGDAGPIGLTWQSERAGDVLQERLLPIVGIGLGVLSVFFIAVAAALHRVAHDLRHAQKNALDLLGRDPLSGLANRLLFNERLDARLSQSAGGTPFAVLFVDLDRFKDVNDTYGHQAGDLLIQSVAERLVNVLAADDVLARFGGDEFAIIQMTPGEAHMTERLAQSILEALAEPFTLVHSAVAIGASIGIALAPEHGRDRETLMRVADAALYQAKQEGRNRLCVFQSRIEERLRLRKLVDDELRDAIEQDRLQLVYQPIISAGDGRIVAVEALVRWPHGQGTISPAEFIPLAEERGLVIPLGEWVLRRACRDGLRWPGLRVAVNVSPVQFRHRCFVESVKRILAETDFDPERLELELTEGVVVDDADLAEASIIDLRAIGIHLALDDFGTGYSSLIYLRRFAFDTIKIDRSFLESMEATGESAILVHSIVHLGRALGLTVTAEGVETQDQQRFLQALGCHQIQGYLISRPVPAEAIDALVADDTPVPLDAVA